MHKAYCKLSLNVIGTPEKLPLARAITIFLEQTLLPRIQSVLLRVQNGYTRRREREEIHRASKDIHVISLEITERVEKGYYRGLKSQDTCQILAYISFTYGKSSKINYLLNNSCVNWPGFMSIYFVTTTADSLARNTQRTLIVFSTPHSSGT